MPPAHLMSSNHKLLTHLSAEQLQNIYKGSAFDVDAPVYIFAGKGTMMSTNTFQNEAQSSAQA